MSEVTRDGETWKLADGTIVRRRTKRLGLVIARQRYTYKGEVRFANNFHLEVMVNRETAHFPLGTDATDAAKKADEIGAYLALPTNTLEKARREYDPRAIARKEKFATLGEVFAAHTSGFRSLGISQKTAKGYQHALVAIMRHVEAYTKRKPVELQPGSKLDLSRWASLSTTALTAKQLVDFKTYWLMGLEDEEEILTAQISADSYIRQAKSVFSVHARKHFEHRGLSLPDLTSWLEVPLFGAKKFFELPATSVVESIFVGLPSLKESDPNAYRAAMLCMHLGLRKTEAACAKWQWIREEDDAPMMLLREDGSFKPKHGHGRKVRFPSWVWNELKSVRASLETILDGKDTERTEVVFARLNTWLKTRGVTAPKPTHELRKLWFSFKAKTEGLLAAQQQGGHRDPKVTSQCYSDNLLPESLLVHWTEKAG